jgi:para-aminobenzoate synthetase component 1
MQIEHLGQYESIEQLFINISALEGPFWLDSALSHDQLGRYSFMGALPVAELLQDAEGVHCKMLGASMTVDQDPFEAINQLMSMFPAITPLQYPFCGGAVGFLSYDLKNQIEVLPSVAEDDLQFPLMGFKVYDVVLVYDHANKNVCLMFHEFVKGYESRVEKIRSALVSDQIKPLVYPKPVTFSSDQTRDQYLKGVESVRAYIRSGDVYQANYTQRISCAYDQSPLGLYLNLRHANPAPFAAYLPYDQFAILSSSPERFIKVREGHIETRPIKGTIKRGKTTEQDVANKMWLKNSIKDQSELLMIVDLERNDLSRICRVGSVKVPELFEIEGYKTVYHLVSTVVGEIDEGTSNGDILKATFPGGSITGAPKIRAMAVIDSLEKHTRGIYTGAIGYIGFDGSMDLNIVIRTLLYQDKMLYFGIGGGIVWDSNPQSEYEESLTKGKALMEAISGGGGYVLEQWGAVGENSDL